MSSRKVSLVVGVLILLFQVSMIIFARFDAMRYFCWAPFDALNRYELTSVVVNDRELSDAEIFARYRIRRQGFDQRSIQHVKDILIQYEQTYGVGDSSRLEMTFDTNGGDAQTWSFGKP